MPPAESGSRVISASNCRVAIDEMYAKAWFEACQARFMTSFFARPVEKLVRNDASRYSKIAWRRFRRKRHGALDASLLHTRRAQPSVCATNAPAHGCRKQLEYLCASRISVASRARLLGTAQPALSRQSCDYWRSELREDTLLTLATVAAPSPAEVGQPRCWNMPADCCITAQRSAAANMAGIRGQTSPGGSRRRTALHPLPRRWRDTLTRDSWQAQMPDATFSSQ